MEEENVLTHPISLTRNCFQIVAYEYWLSTQYKSYKIQLSSSNIRTFGFDFRKKVLRHDQPSVVSQRPKLLESGPEQDRAAS